MSLALIAPACALASVLVAGPMVLAADRRTRKQLRQVAFAIELSHQDSAPHETKNLRREKIRFQRVRQIARGAFRYDPDFPEAYVVPAPLVLAASAIAGVAAGLFASTVLSSMLSLMIGIVACGMAVRGLFGWQHDRCTNRLRSQLPDALQFVVSAVRAGLPVTEALRGITRDAPEPTRGRFALVVNEIGLGRPISEALLALYQRTRVTEYGIFAVTLAVQTKSGGQLAETIQALADTVRERISLAARAKALAGEGTVSATILCVLPVVTGLALSVIQPGYLDPLFADPRGKRLFLIGVAALLAGIWMMRRMIAGVVRE